MKIHHCWISLEKTFLGHHWKHCHCLYGKNTLGRPWTCIIEIKYFQ